MPAKRVLSVGQCGPDHHALSRFLKSAFDVEVIAVDTGPDALDLLRKSDYALVLVNRKLDLDYSDGIDIIRDMQADAELSRIPVMLVTNYPEQQDNAVALGAQRGFGKLELGHSTTIERLTPFLAD